MAPIHRSAREVSFRSRARNTPFAGATGTGVPVMTIVGGKVVSP